jgi:RNA polymerase sigma factor, sigma-70 family
MANTVDNNGWREFVAGKADGFRILYDRYVDQLLDFGCRFDSDKSLIKDLIHDLFLDLYRYRPRLDPDVNARAYLYSSLRRRIVAARRKQKKFAALEEITEGEIPFLIEWDLEQLTIRNEEERAKLSWVAQELAMLPRRQQEALYLRFTCGLTYDQVADIMEVSEASCRTGVYRAIKSIRTRLGVKGISTQLFTILLLQNERVTKSGQFS